MKKVLLSFIAVSGLFANSFAQTCAVGYATTGLYDDYSGASDPGNADNSGLYSWGEATLGGDANPNFKATFARNTTSGMIDYTVTQGKGEYVPFGISFGDTNGDGSGTVYTIDLSGDGTFSCTLKNNYSIPLNFRIAVQDINNKTIDTYAAATSDLFSNAWQYPIQITIAAGATGSFTSKTFTGGVYANYGTSSFDNTCDLTKIKGINFTVIDAAQDAADGFKPYAITNAQVSIDQVKVGTCLTAGNQAAALISSSKLYPNPVSDMAKVELNLKSASSVKVTLSDMMGKEVAVITEGTFSSLTKEFSVTNLKAGIYTVNYTINGEAAKAELLMVK